MGTEVFLDLAAFFTSPTGLPMTYTLNDNPTGSNALSISGSVLKGIVTTRELQFQQPIPIIVGATDGVERADQIWYLNVFVANTPPVATTVPAMTLSQGLYTEAPFAQYFSDPSSKVLTFALLGLPENSGLALHPTRGVLSGTPSFADVSGPRPWTLLLTADNGGYKGIVQTPLYLTVRPVNQPPFVNPPIPSPATATEGKAFYGFLSRHFQDPDSDQLTYTINGLALGSAITLDPQTGALGGTPNRFDRLASPLKLTVRADDKRGGVVFASFELVVGKYIPPPEVYAIPPQMAQQGQPFLFDLKNYFKSERKLQFVVQGLPDDTGLVLGFDSGILAGTPGASDVSDGVKEVTIYVHDGKGGKASAKMYLSIGGENRLPVANEIPGVYTPPHPQPPLQSPPPPTLLPLSRPPPPLLLSSFSSSSSSSGASQAEQPLQPGHQRVLLRPRLSLNAFWVPPFQLYCSCVRAYACVCARSPPTLTWAQSSSLSAIY
jgi:hypothetical protein